MRRTVMVGAVLVMFATACGTSGTGHGVSVSPPIVVTSPSPVPPESPDATPSVDGPLQTGGATVSTTGELTVQVSLPTLVEPDVWGPPPSPMSLTWDEPTGQSLSLSGTSFTSRAATGDDRALTFVLTGEEGPLQFTSSSGECSVTITPALPDNMGGVFACLAITDTEGTTTVNASGTFSATG
jgi:hypothetical protein